MCGGGGVRRREGRHRRLEWRWSSSRGRRRLLVVVVDLNSVLDWRSQEVGCCMGFVVVIGSRGLEGG